MLRVSLPPSPSNPSSKHMETPWPGTCRWQKHFVGGCQSQSVRPHGRSDLQGPCEDWPFVHDTLPDLLITDHWPVKTVKAAPSACKGGY